MLVFPERLLDGDLPNRDFLHLYGPGIALGAGRGVTGSFGTSLGAQRAVGYLPAPRRGRSARGRCCDPWGPWVAATGGAIAAAS